MGLPTRGPPDPPNLHHFRSIRSKVKIDVGGSAGVRHPEVPRHDRASNPPEGIRKVGAPYFLPFLLLLFLPFFFAGIVLSLLRGEEMKGRSTPPI